MALKRLQNFLYNGNLDEEELYFVQDEIEEYIAKNREKHINEKYAKRRLNREM